MKLFWGTIALFVFLSISCVYAHQPSWVISNYDSVKNELSVTITHRVSNYRRHYITRIDLIKNGRIVDSKQFNRQFNKGIQKANFTIHNIKPTDILSIKAYCNITGELEKDIELK